MRTVNRLEKVYQNACCIDSAIYIAVMTDFLTILAEISTYITSLSAITIKRGSLMWRSATAMSFLNVRNSST